MSKHTKATLFFYGTFFFAFGSLATLLLFSPMTFYMTEKVLNGYVFYDNNAKVYIEEGALGELNSIYQRSEGYEFFACLDGNVNVKRDENGENLEIFTITNVSKYEVSGSKTQTESFDCEFSYIHSHPMQEGSKCVFTAVDNFAFKEYQKKNGNDLQLLMCGKNRLVFNMKGNYDERDVILS